jgi:hypothetical protein
VKKERGFAMIELVTGLAVAFFIVTATAEFFALNKKLFDRLKTRQTGEQAVLGAADRLRIDLLHAGEGLALPVSLGLLEPVLVEQGTLRAVQAERALRLAADAPAGSERFSLASTAGITAGRELALCEKDRGEVAVVKSVEGKSMVVTAPLRHSYSAASAEILLLSVVVYATDGATLRRKVNRASAQPLLENAGEVAFRHELDSSLVTCGLSLSPPGGTSHEVTVLVKNAALNRR